MSYLDSVAEGGFGIILMESGVKLHADIADECNSDVGHV